MPRRKATNASSAMINAFLDRLFDRTLTEREHRIAIDQLQSALPCTIFVNGPLADRSEYDVLVFFEEGRFEALPRKLRHDASHIEEVKRDGSGVVYKSRTGKTGPIPRTSMPGYSHTRRTAWDRVLGDDD